MINVAAIRMQQFGVQFYQASLTASDIDKLVRFEVLSYGDNAQAPVRGGKPKPGAPQPSKVNWDFLERRIASSDKAYQRQIIRKKIDELVQYYEQCRQARDLPSIPGAVIISCDEKLTFQPADERLARRHPEGARSAKASCARSTASTACSRCTPTSIASRARTSRCRRSSSIACPEDHVVQMFVTINAKHTRLNASHLVSLSGRQLYRDEALATGHDVVRALNDREDSPLYDEIKLLGVGRGRVAQAPLAQELKKLFAADGVFGKKSGDSHEEAKKFFVNYFKQIALVFGGAWNGRKYSIRSASALRAFVRVAPEVIKRLDQEHADRSDFRAIGRVIAPWGRRIGDLRFETEGAWKRAGTTVDSLAKELRLALMYPEGASV